MFLVYVVVTSSFYVCKFKTICRQLAFICLQFPLYFLSAPKVLGFFGGEVILGFELKAFILSYISRPFFFPEMVSLNCPSWALNLKFYLNFQNAGIVGMCCHAQLSC